jgi:hypothetical protein
MGRKRGRERGGGEEEKREERKVNENSLSYRVESTVVVTRG